MTPRPMEKRKENEKSKYKDDDGLGHTAELRERNRAPKIDSQVSPAARLSSQQAGQGDTAPWLAPDAILLLYDDAKGCILLAHRPFQEILQSDTMQRHARPSILRHLWELSDVLDRCLFHAAIAKCIVFTEVIHTVRCTVWRLSTVTDIPVSKPS